MKPGMFALVIALFFSPVALQAQSAVYDCSKLYEKAIPAVVQVQTDDGTGSGFLISDDGHIATNFHVIRDSKYLAVQFPDGRKVKAVAVATNSRYDMAILKVNSEIVRGIRPLPIISAALEKDLKPGIPVVALGSPLDQKFLITEGILSKVDDIAMLGDFVLQPGNSGGPLLNMDGEVVGINTFGEGAIAGAIRIGTLRSLVEAKGLGDSATVEPSAELLPALNPERYPVSTLNRKIQTEPLDLSAYRFKAGDFQVTAVTPVLIGKLQGLHERVLEMNRFVRRGKDISDPEFHGFEDPYYEWHRMTENTLDYAVTFEIRPEAGQVPHNKMWSFMSPIVRFGKRARVDEEFKGEFLAFRLYRDGKLIEPITPGRSVIEGDEARPRLLDEAYAGSYVYSPDVFATGNEFRLQIIDARQPDTIHKEVVFKSDSPLIRQLRSDFAAASLDLLFVPHP
jgi:hypothetical protein